MNVSDMKYSNQLPYPSKPSKPSVNSLKTAEEHRRYADRLDEYEKQAATYRLTQKAWHDEEAACRDRFKHDALEECGILNHPKADKAWNLAVEKYASESKEMIFAFLEQLAELMVD